MESASRSKRKAHQWSQLPGEILTAIAKLLDSDIELLRLRAVCSSWRSSLLSLSPLSSHFPLKIPPPTFSFPSRRPTVPGHFSVFLSFVLRLSSLSSPSSPSFLAKIFPTNRNTFSLLNPLSAEQITQFPKTPHINLLHFRISHIATSYHLKLIPDDPKLPLQSWNYIKKVVVLPNFTILLLSHEGELRHWKFGDHDNTWTPVQIPFPDYHDDDEVEQEFYYYHFIDVISFGGHCYAIDYTGVLVKLDSDFINLVRLTRLLPYFSDYSENKYLIPCDDNGNIYVVTKLSHSGPNPEYYDDRVDGEEYVLADDSGEGIDIDLCIKVFALNEIMPLSIRVFVMNKKIGNWRFVGSLGEKVFFLGDDVSFLLSAIDFDGCKPGCLYMTDECFRRKDDEENDKVYGQRTGVYRYSLDECFAVRLAVCPEYAKPFWPPPRWLLWRSISTEC